MAEEVKETPVADVQSTEKTEEPQKKTYSEEEYNALRTQLESLEKSTKDNEDFKKKFEQSELEPIVRLLGFFFNEKLWNIC